MEIDVVFLPRFAVADQFTGRAVAVFDVLRATTTMAVALARGAGPIRVFDDLESASTAAAGSAESRPLLVGESNCLPPPGFDLGNSPVAMHVAAVTGRTLFMSTTNGTRAIVAARGAGLLITAALVNAKVAAKALAKSGMNITLLCAGTNGAVCMEDVIGAGAVIAESPADAVLTDAARLALATFEARASGLTDALSKTTGGRNVIMAGLGEDVAFCAGLNTIDVVGRVLDGPLRVVRAE